MAKKNQSGGLSGLYLHVPFCVRKCSYCDFYSVVPAAGSVAAWVEAVIRETALYRGLFGEFDTLFVGGGTPTCIPDRDLARLMESVRTLLSFAPGSEVTCEANPDDLSGEKLTQLRSLGVTRLSIGVQSFRDRDLAFLGRRHDGRSAMEAIDRARRAGFRNIGIDLIYGLPGQGIKRWTENLETALSFEPEHLSCYQLTVEEKTPLGCLVRRGGVRLSTESKERSLFVATSRYLADRGYDHYEISNFAKTARYRCRHNVKYWTHVPYLGLGPSAHSFDGRKRWWNTRSVTAYCAVVNRGDRPIDGEELLSDDQLRLERLMLGLRTSRGAGIGDVSREAGLRELSRGKFIEIRDERVVPTVKGFLIADRLVSMLF